ncbi:MAG: glycosyltransferase [Desulfohalobiaceae bacterium]
MSRPAISVVLPCYNAAATLPQAMESLLNQTCEDFEVLAVDDGSTDETPRILQRFAGADRRIIPLLLPHGGIASALNAGLERARGRYIARMDADDESLPQRLEQQARYLEEHPGIGLVGCRVIYGGEREANRGYALHVDWLNELLEPESIRANRFVESPFAHPSIMFRAELPIRLGGYRQGPFPEDYELLLRWMEHGVAMAKLDRELLVWNDPPDRLSRTDRRLDRWAFHAVKAPYLARWLRENNPFHPFVHILGAGRLARRRIALLERQGIRVQAFLDSDPKKAGRLVRGRPVLSSEDLPPPGRCFCLSYVGARHDREATLAYLHHRGHRPERDFLSAA